MDRTDPRDHEMYNLLLIGSYMVVGPSYVMSCVLNFETGPYWLHVMADIDINPSSMGPIFRAWIGPTMRVPKWTIRHWAAAIW